MTPQLEISIEGRLGVIALNRPEAINALTREMIEGISETLATWRDDPQVRVVLFEGRGPRGFCSGGDVRAVRSLVLAVKTAEADAYFAAEYAMNLMIATYPKPIAAIGHGAVMGGGLGILGHARYSFASTDARFAMPEAAIGFVCDIGINAILALVPAARALAFLMSGLAVGMGDALTLGLCDAAIEPSRAGAVRSGIAAAATAADAETALVMLMQAESVQPGDATLCAQADRLAEDFEARTAAEIVAAVKKCADRESDLEGLASTLVSRSPTSLEAILTSHCLARQNPEIATVLALDLRLATFMAHQPDFAEGVRAVLVDKDHKPLWRPASFAEVDLRAIAEAAKHRP